MGVWAGPAFPFGRDTNGALSPREDIRVIHTSVVNILTTRKGSWEMDPTAGSMVPYLVFELNDYATMQLLRYYAMTEVAEQETRIEVLAADVLADEDNYLVTVAVLWRMRTDATQTVYGTRYTWDTKEMPKAA